MLNFMLNFKLNFMLNFLQDDDGIAGNAQEKSSSGTEKYALKTKNPKVRTQHTRMCVCIVLYLWACVVLCIFPSLPSVRLFRLLFFFFFFFFLVKTGSNSQKRGAFGDKDAKVFFLFRLVLHGLDCFDFSI